MAFNQNKYISDFVKENYDRIDLRIPKGKRALLRDLAIQKGITDDRGKISMTKLILDAVEAQYGIDLSKSE